MSDAIEERELRADLVVMKQSPILSVLAWLMMLGGPLAVASIGAPHFPPGVFGIHLTVFGLVLWNALRKQNIRAKKEMPEISIADRPKAVKQIIDTVNQVVRYASPSKNEALSNSVRLMQEGGAKMIKLESGGTQIEIVEFLAAHDIAVCAHLGLKPQSVHKTGGFRVQGREEDAAELMIDNAKRLESAGADIVLLECIPSALGKAITAALQVPVIGIGAGPDTDGQILVLYDILDITTGRKPRFVRNFLAGESGGVRAARRPT